MASSTNDEIFKRAALFCERHVLLNQTQLIAALLKNWGFQTFKLERIENAFAYRANTQYGDEWFTENQREVRLARLRETVQEIEDNDPGRFQADARREAELLIEAYESAELEPVEIYEWWAVTEFGAAMLRAQHEPLLANEYGIWWGRTTTNEAVELHPSIQEIAENFFGQEVEP
jgi:hypothetical protein